MVEQKRLFNALSDNLKPVVAFSLLSGLRRTEVISLRWADIDFEGMRATHTVKGGEKVVLPLTTAMVTLLANQPKVCPQVFTYVCQRSTARHGVRRKKGERYPFSTQGWAREWRFSLKQAGIDDFRFHDLRHTAATRTLRATGNLALVQMMLGHSDIGTTARYAHVVESDLRDGMEKAQRSA